MDRLTKDPQTWNDFASELETMMKQRAKLGLFDAESDAIETLSVKRGMDDLLILLLLGDYTPSSKRLNVHSLKPLSQRFRVGIVKCGLALWSEGERIQWV